MNEMLSQEEINALLESSSDTSEVQEELDMEQKDIIGEIGNINMGTAATTLYNLLNHKVEISTPQVSIIQLSSLKNKFEKPSVGLKIKYKEGLEGVNLLVLKQEDVKIITNLMLGGDGNPDLNEPISDMELSAISEAMNQMVGSASTSLSSMINSKIDIETPTAAILDDNSDKFFEELNLSEEKVTCICFRMIVEGLIDSEIMQILPINFSKSIIDKVKNGTKDSSQESKPTMNLNTAETANITPTPAKTIQTNSLNQNAANAANSQNINTNVNVQPAVFQNFEMSELMQQKENINIIRDVPLEVTVELGRSKKTIKEILEFNPGTIIELDKIAGEPIDILVNGKFVANGEVVVIDESFGIRITSIISVEERI